MQPFRIRVIFSPQFVQRSKLELTETVPFLVASVDAQQSLQWRATGKPETIPLDDRPSTTKSDFGGPRNFEDYALSKTLGGDGLIAKKQKKLSGELKTV
jgi:hypothetical protein